ncbi:transcriptional regulator [Erwinia sp. ErVv1]|uniref:transcriptional regulator n=1 Tax=Erwinia sp. ErVv1 TaxID=1603299 RepID=UPI000B06AA93|nr:transcriptional regulator [Erwinia sp. ErVv1]
MDKSLKEMSASVIGEGQSPKKTQPLTSFFHVKSVKEGEAMRHSSVNYGQNYNKPCQSHQKIIDSLSSFSVISEHDEISRKKRRYRFLKNALPVVYLLSEGDYLLNTQGSNKLLNIVSSPYVVGMIHNSDDTPLYLERIDYGKISHIPLETFWHLICKKNLLDDAMLLICEHFSDLTEYITLNKSNAYEEVKSLSHYWEKLPPHLLKRYSAMYLIENSSWLSKSSISRALKIMKERGEITLEKGHMVRPE